MTPGQVERAAREDPDARPLTEDDLKRMKRTPQVKIIRRVQGLIALDPDYVDRLLNKKKFPR